MTITVKNLTFTIVAIIVFIMVVGLPMVEWFQDVTAMVDTNHRVES